MKPEQQIKIYCMIDRVSLIDLLRQLIETGHEISVVTPLKEFTSSLVDGGDVTDWLIIYREL